MLARRRTEHWRRAMNLAALALALGLFPSALAVEAQPALKVYRIGVLLGRPPSSPATPDAFNAFRGGLRDLGWVEGRNVVLEVQRGEGAVERLPELAAELVRLKVDVIFCPGGDPAALAARRATTAIPIVTLSVDPVGLGLAASLARPGGNVTGLSIFAAELGAKRLELLREMIPGISRVAILWNVAYPGKDLEFRETQVAARALGVTLQSVEVRSVTDLDTAFGAIRSGRPDALITFSEPLTLTHRQRIVDFAMKIRVPMISEIREFADAGGLMTYGSSLPDLGRRAATYVDRILKGARPADLPFEQPTKFELIINARTAKALGFTISYSLLLRADEVLQ
jgi:putative ABC transport system substrate-binding protein